jgi:hypothetical protein
LAFFRRLFYDGRKAAVVAAGNKKSSGRLAKHKILA